MNNKIKWSAITVIVIILFFTGYIMYGKYKGVSQPDQSDQYASQQDDQSDAVGTEQEAADLEENDFDDEIQGFNEDIAAVEANISELAAQGMDVKSYQTNLQNVRTLVSQAKEKIDAGALVEGDNFLEKADEELSNLEEAVDSALEINK